MQENSHVMEMPWLAYFGWSDVFLAPVSLTPFSDLLSPAQPQLRPNLETDFVQRSERRASCCSSFKFLLVKHFCSNVLAIS